MSPRATTPNQTLASSPTLTCPMRSAPGATKALRATWGVLLPNS